MNEEWRMVAGYDGEYDISNLGQVRSWKRSEPHILRPALNGRGRYPRVCLRHKGKARSVLVHVMVLEAFAGPRPDGMQAAHLDGNSSNNVVSNLQWATIVENQGHKYIHGTMAWGERSAKARLTDALVREMRAKRDAGASVKELSVEYDVSETTVYYVTTRRTWKHVA